MKLSLYPLLGLGSAMVFGNIAFAQGIQQTTSIRAPVAAIAIGPSQSRIIINEVRASSSRNVRRNVSISKPIFAVAMPRRNITVRIGADR